MVTDLTTIPDFDAPPGGYFGIPKMLYHGHL